MKNTETQSRHSVQRLVRQSDKPITLFPWEQKEYERHLQVMHNERRQKEFLLGSILRIAKAVNATDPVTAGELLDVIDDCTKQINRMPNDQAHPQPGAAVVERNQRNQ